MAKHLQSLLIGVVVVMFADAARGEGISTTAAKRESPTLSPSMSTALLSAPIPHCAAWERDGFASIQVNVDLVGCNILGDAANEPSIAASFTGARKIVIGWRQFDSVSSDFRQAGFGYSHDGGHRWVFAGSLTPGVSGSDPVLASDTDGTIYYLSINIDETRIFRSNNGGLAWLAPRRITEGLFDKPWMTIDHSDSSGRNNIYISSYWGGLFRSVDRGESFYYFPLSAEAGETVATGPDGAVYLVSGTNYAWVNKSSDVMNPSVTSPTIVDWYLRVGENYGHSESPNSLGLKSQAWVAVDHSPGASRGNVYVLTMTSLDPLETDPGDLIFVRGEEGGTRWTRPVAVNDDFPGHYSWQWFPAMSVAPNGRIDVVWNDTRNSQQTNLSELFYSYSNDAGRTWSPNVPVSPMFDSRVGRPSGNSKLGDYYHCVSDNLGLNVAYAATFNGEQDIYFLRIGPWDCNGNEIDDAVDISSEAASDCNDNEVPDECEYRVDIDGDGLTTIEDFTALAERLAMEPQSHQATEGIAGCDQLFDADHDSDIDLADFAYLQRVFVSP